MNHDTFPYRDNCECPPDWRRIFSREGRCNGSNKSRSWSFRGWFIRYQPSWHRPTAICSEDGSLHDPCRLSSCRRFLPLRYLKRNVSTWLRIATELDEIANSKIKARPEPGLNSLMLEIDQSLSNGGLTRI